MTVISDIVTELRNIKTSIITALGNKGITSSGQWENFGNEISLIPTAKTEAQKKYEVTINNSNETEQSIKLVDVRYIDTLRSFTPFVPDTTKPISKGEQNIPSDMHVLATFKVFSSNSTKEPVQRFYTVKLTPDTERVTLNLPELENTTDIIGVPDKQFVRISGNFKSPYLDYGCLVDGFFKDRGDTNCGSVVVQSEGKSVLLLENPGVYGLSLHWKLGTVTKIMINGILPGTALVHYGKSGDAGTVTVYGSDNNLSFSVPPNQDYAIISFNYAPQIQSILLLHNVS